MMDNNGKLPIGIVNNIIQKISDFTKELEVLRAQLPDKSQMNSGFELGRQKTVEEYEKMDVKLTAFGNSLKSTLNTIKIVAALLGLVVVLSMFGAKLITYWENIHPKQEREALEERIEELQKATDDRFLEILRQIEKFHNGNSPEDAGDKEK